MTHQFPLKRWAQEAFVEWLGETGSNPELRGRARTPETLFKGYVEDRVYSLVDETIVQGIENALGVTKFFDETRLDSGVLRDLLDEHLREGVGAQRLLDAVLAAIANVTISKGTLRAIRVAYGEAYREEAQRLATRHGIEAARRDAEKLLNEMGLAADNTAEDNADTET
jgi:hypothetical protein